MLSRYLVILYASQIFTNNAKLQTTELYYLLFTKKFIKQTLYLLNL